MLRKTLISLALAAALAATGAAQNQGGGGGNRGGNTGGNQGGNNQGGGQQQGGNINQGPGRGGGVSQDRLDQMRNIQRPIFISGKVLLASGEAPLDRVLIKRQCGTQTFAEGYTDSKGNFSFQVGAANRFASMDASIGGNATGLPESGILTSRRSADPAMGIDLTGCALVADAPGYRSDPIWLGRRRALDRPDVGTIILTPLGGSQGGTISATSLAAPKKARAAYQKASSELSKGEGANTRKAVADLEKAVSIYPEFAAAWNLLGRVRRQEGDLAGAEEALQKAIAADQRYLAPYEPLARMKLDQNDWQGAYDLADFASGVDPSDATMRWYKAVSQFELGRLDDAVSSLADIQSDEEALRTFPQSLHLSGLIHAQRGQYKDAASAYERYLELQPEAPSANDLKRQLYEWGELGLL